MKYSYKMNTDQLIVLNIALQIITLLVSCLSPLVASIGYFIKHVRTSQCCGSEVQVRSPEEEHRNKSDKSYFRDIIRSQPIEIKK